MLHLSFNVETEASVETSEIALSNANLPIASYRVCVGSILASSCFYEITSTIIIL